MVEFALSIRQPWVDLIMRGVKTIEVREWQVERRGPILIHSASALDWRSVELFGYQDALKLPRGGVVGYAEIVDVIPLTHDKWLEHLDAHLVVHQRRLPQFGAVLANVRDFGRVLRCSGKQFFFPVPPKVIKQSAKILASPGPEP
jgi:hypothetical protein